MDSMRSLNSSLPSSQPNRSVPPEELLQAFRTAALSVTNLYKSAATSQSNARQAGYQDALEDLLKFLDRENLGLQDGEGWRVRQWATARYDGSTSQQDEAEEEEEHEEAETNHSVALNERERSAAPREHSEESNGAPRQNLEDDSDTTEQRPIFHFTASARSENTMQTDGPSSVPNVEEQPSSSSPSSPIRVEVLNRNSRPTSRAHHSRHNTYANARDFTFTAGTKRKLQFPDFFDISNFNEKRDGFGGGGGSKKGRLS